MFRRPRSLPSFPTRRSSDLPRAAALGLPLPYPCHSAAAGVSKDSRSEEHTSELQSRPHLVCRLLLEKKKKKRNTGRASRSPTIVQQGGAMRVACVHRGKE